MVAAASRSFVLSFTVACHQSDKEEFRDSRTNDAALSGTSSAT
jgi:hypothetical protein